MILQQLTEEELDALDQMSRFPGYDKFVNYLLRCMNTGALSSCYTGGEEASKLAGAAIAFRHLATTLINARAAKEEVNAAIASAHKMGNRDIISP